MSKNKKINYVVDREFLSCGHSNNLKLTGNQPGVCPKNDSPACATATLENKERLVDSLNPKDHPKWNRLTDKFEVKK